MRAPEHPLYVAVAWIEAHCVVPDGFDRGRPFQLTTEQARFLLNHYDVRSDAEVGQLAPAFAFRRSQLVRSQKWGKSPLAAAQICLEGVGPALFAGWARGGERWDCREHDCGCGFTWEYEPGEPMGMSWPTALIQITATSEEQTDNIYDALRPMIMYGPLAELIPRTGEEFIRLPGGGRIDPVTSKASSRLGQRVTFVPQDETGIWLPNTSMAKVADVQRRGLAGMGGRAVEYTNAWDPAENSVAQQTAESRAEDVYRDHVSAPLSLSYTDKRERRRIHRLVYGDSLKQNGGWVDLDAIEAEAAELLERDPAQAERFFGNRIVAGSDSWWTRDQIATWETLATTADVPAKAKITLGFDGSQYDDWTVIRARWVNAPDGKPYGFTPAFNDGKPMYWSPVEHGGEVPRGEVNAAVEQLFDRFDVIRMYADPELWQSELDAWIARYGEKRVIPWATYRTRQMAAALERLTTDTGSESYAHDGCPILRQHLANARKVRRPGGMAIGKPADHQKIDMVVADTLAHEAAGDVVAAGLLKSKPNYVYVA